MIPMTFTAAGLWRKPGGTWQKATFAIFALACGLVVGPFLSNALGWQVTASSSRAQVRAGVVEQQAAYCEVRARADVQERNGQLDWRVRNDLASRWSTLPGTSALDFEVVKACALKLARR
jgi:hypothetical protein